MPLIHCKAELKLKWMKHCVLATSNFDNTNANPNNITFNIKNTKLYVPVVTLSASNFVGVNRLCFSLFKHR